MSVSVCVFVCPRSYLRIYTADLHQFFFVHVTYGRGSILLWRCGDMLCTSGFMDDVIFAHKPRLFRRRRPAEAQCTRRLWLWLQTVRTNTSCMDYFSALKVTSRVATPGAESAVYDCLVCYSTAIGADFRFEVPGQSPVGLIGGGRGQWVGAPWRVRSTSL